MRETTEPVSTVPATLSASRSFWRQVLVVLRNRILTGSVIVAPILITVYFVGILGSFLHQKFEVWLAGYIKRSAELSSDLTWLQNDQVSYVLVILLSLVLIGITLYLIGLFSTAYIVRRGVSFGERIISKIPVISGVYSIAKQILDAVAAQQEGKGAFKRVVFIDYPRPGIRSVAFATGETTLGEGEEGEVLVNLFLPTTPNPTSGFLLMLPASEVLETNLTRDQAFKFILSFGIMTPQNLMVRPYSPANKKQMPAAVIAAPSIRAAVEAAAAAESEGAKAERSPEAAATAGWDR